VPAVSREIPLFPLTTVLFPGTFLPVQITEDAHRELLRDCADQSDRLGVILMPGADGSGGRTTVPFTTGCLASIAMLLQDSNDALPTGALLYGEQRMRVVDYDQQGHYLTGHVDILEDYTGMHAERRTRQVSDLFRQYLDLVRQRYQTDMVQMAIPANPILASYMLASVLYLPSEVKQRWLESDSASSRLKEQVFFLRGECEKLSVFLALAQNARVHNSMPGYHVYTSLVSRN